MGAVKKEIFIGAAVGFFVVLAGLFLGYEYLVSQYELPQSIRMFHNKHLYGKVLFLAAVPNIFVFFLYLKKKQDHRAKGILGISILIALITFGLKFI
ncbi:hypothetical protein [Polaribacter sp. HL-MS24]|uniref:hypothetical protein n=1 Tax=Polaribacter sp. HL-MS24 TaxID=3077735 RepID=UPI002934DB52|nr:hypothetical protein [Polaribacter sp. HL-MS24]WOC39605.1 hypothetical protein RRF69_08020 [Polaribacter sp. HL-MS24]